MEFFKGFIANTIINPVKANLAGVLFWSGTLLVFIGSIFGGGIDGIKYIPQGSGEFILKSGSAILGAGVFAVIMKSAQFTDLFQKHIYDVFYDPARVNDGDTLIEKWRAITNFMLQDVLPKSHKNASKLIEQQFFNSEIEYHFEDYRIQYDFTIDSGTRDAQIRVTTKANIILSPHAINPVLKQTISFDGDGENQMLAFRLNGEELPLDLYKKSSEGHNLYALELSLKKYIQNASTDDDKKIKMERTVMLKQNLRDDPYIRGYISRYIMGATVSVKKDPKFKTHFARFGLGELPKQHHLADDACGNERWTLATPDCLLLPGQGYILVPLLH